MQLQARWNKYLKVSFRPWTNKDDYDLLEAVKKHGVRDWAAVSREFNDESRDRYRCRQRFDTVYRQFKRNPATAVERLAQLDNYKGLNEKRAQTLASLERTFQEWKSNMNKEKVISNIPLPNCDLEASSMLANGEMVSNRLLSRFVRYLQTLLPLKESHALEPLPQRKFRTLPDQPEPPHLRPTTKCARIRPFGAKSTPQQQRRGRPRGRRPVKQDIDKRRPPLTNCERELARLFNASHYSKMARRKKANPEELIFLTIATRGLDEILNFSALNLDSKRFGKFSTTEQQLLENYLFHSDIAEVETVPTRRKSYSRPPTPSEGGAEDEEEPGHTNVIIPCWATLVAFRGALAHADHTAELAWSLEPDEEAALRKRTLGGAKRAVEEGINNHNIERRLNVGSTLFDADEKVQSPSST